MKFLKNACAFIWAYLTYNNYKKKLLKLRNPDEIMINLAGHWGDIVLGLLYVDQYKLETNQKIVCVVDEKYKEFAQSYNIDRIITHKSNTLTHMYKYVGSIKEWRNKKGNRIFLGTPPTYSNFKGYHIQEVMRDIIYNVSQDNPTFPTLPNIPITTIPNFEENKNRIIIFNPYSASHKNIFPLCQALADSLQDTDYILYTNVVGNQQPLQGTTPLNCSMFEFFNIAQQAKLFVSVRSGIVDTLCGTNSNLVVLYTARNWFRSFYSILPLKPNNTLEIYHTGKDYSIPTKNFLNFLNKLNSK